MENTIELQKRTVGDFGCMNDQELMELGIVTSAFQTLRGNKREMLAYVGMPITSGKRLYEVFAKYHVSNIEALTDLLGKNALYDLVIKPNILEGVALAENLGMKKSNQLFIAPSVFEAKRWKWSQAAYMSLWYRVIAELTGSHYVMDGWEYSNGGVKEVGFSLLIQWRWFNVVNSASAFKNFGIDLSMVDINTMASMRLYDSNGIELKIDRILELLIQAVQWLKTNQFDYSVQISIAWDIKKLVTLRNRCGPYDAKTSLFFQQCEILNNLI